MLGLERPDKGPPPGSYDRRSARAALEAILTDAARIARDPARNHGTGARKAYDLPRNPIADVDRIRLSYDAARFDFYSPEEAYALARATASDQDAAVFLTAAFAGLRRGELVALC